MACFCKLMAQNWHKVMPSCGPQNWCYWIVLNIRADKHLYGHLNPCSGLLCRKCWLGCGGSDLWRELVREVNHTTECVIDLFIFYFEWILQRSNSNYLEFNGCSSQTPSKSIPHILVNYPSTQRLYKCRQIVNKVVYSTNIRGWRQSLVLIQ